MHTSFTDAPITGVGLGLRHRHFQNFLEDKPDVPWLEIHTENFFHLGSAAAKYLEKIREDYPLSAHSVGLSLGSASTTCPAREEHLRKIKQTIDYFEPKMISDHLSWSADDTPYYVPDLLPIPYTEEALAIMITNIDRAQELLGRQLLIENPSAYLSYTHSDMTEWEFLNLLVKKTGCGLLLDVNNIYVSAHNHGWSAEEFLHNINHRAVQEIHLAGYTVRNVEGREVYIDTHGAPVYDPVWALYEQALALLGTIPTLIEWDTNVPELSVLLEEKARADRLWEKRKAA